MITGTYNSPIRNKLPSFLVRASNIMKVIIRINPTFRICFIPFLSYILPAIGAVRHEHMMAGNRVSEAVSDDTFRAF